MGTNKLFGDNSDNNSNENVSGEDALKLLVGEGAKYKTVEDLARAALHGQSHISKIEQENVALRDSQLKASSIDEILAAIKGGGSQQQSDDNLQQDDNPAKGSDPVDMKATIEQMLNQRESQSTAAKNAEAVRVALAKALGDQAGSIYSKIGSSLGVDLDKLSQESPQAVINLVLQQRPANQDNTLPHGSIRGQEPTTTSGDLNYEAIQLLHKAGKLPRHEKFRLENEQLSKLGSARFWAK